MTFKKDYINYLLYTVVSSPGGEYTENYRLRKLVDSIIAIDDVMKITYLVGKTAGLELLFKYLLYISDKIDKSQVTIFNLKDNFEYDKINIAKICAKINQYKSENVQEAIKSITEDIKEEKSDDVISTGEINIEDDKSKDAIKIDAGEDDNVTNLVEMEDIDTTEQENDSEDTGLTLIENKETYTGEAEVFELDSISESVENSDKETENESANGNIEDIITDSEDDETDTSDDEKLTNDDTALYEIENIEDDVNSDGNDEDAVIEETIKLPDIIIEVRKPRGSSQDEEHVKEEAITNEAYYTFETKFFEEVKILEKLLATVIRDCINDDNGKVNEKCLQSTTEIIGITSELSNLSRQLSFDLIADIFLTMNIYFTKSISQPEILTGERVKLLDSSLALVNSLIKGEDYLNYDTIVDKMEKLKQDITTEQKAEYKSEQTETEVEESIGTGEEKTLESAEISEKNNSFGKTYENDTDEYRPITEKPALKKSQLETANFKLKYLIKEFEKSFTAINNLRGEYSKFDALEKISELNNALRLIAKISAAIKNIDALKLAEVTYVFLKYVKDYRMDMQEPEIQQIVKYIIFTFKMLLTNRKPEDFNVLVQHLNNPVKIFADS